MRKLYFEDKYAVMQLVGEYENEDKAVKALVNDVRRRTGKKPPYIRYYCDEHGIVNYDYGSHSEFYYLYPKNKEYIKEGE